MLHLGRLYIKGLFYFSHILDERIEINALKHCCYDFLTDAGNHWNYRLLSI